MFSLYSINSITSTYHKMTYIHDLKSPTFLCDLYPKTKLLNWTPSKVGTFMVSTLLIGTPKNKQRSAEISEQSFKELIQYSKELNNYRNSILENDKSCQLFSPMELFELIPEVRLLNWNPSRIGLFFKSRLLVGIDNGIKPSLIELNSFKSLIAHANRNLLAKKVNFV